jgi:hypothetical protein
MTTPLLPNHNHYISLTAAQAMTALYRAEKENILATEYKGQNILCICETFNREAFDTLLAEEGCEGIRIYFGMLPDLKVRLLAVAVNEDNEDILPEETPALLEGEDERKIVEFGRPCPDFCPIIPL